MYSTMADDPRRERRAALLLDKLREAGGKPLGVRDLMQRAKLHPGERTEVKRVLRDLARTGEVARDGKRFSFPAARPPAEEGAPQRRGHPERVPLHSRRGGV